MKPRPPGSFAERLTVLRRNRGLTQGELGARIGVSKRVIAHYETGQSDRPAAPLVVELANALDVSLEELLGHRAPSANVDPRTARLMKRLRRVADLPRADQRAVLKHIEALLTARGMDRDDGKDHGAARIPRRSTAKRTGRRRNDRR